MRLRKGDVKYFHPRHYRIVDDRIGDGYCIRKDENVVL